MCFSVHCVWIRKIIENKQLLNRNIYIYKKKSSQDLGNVNFWRCSHSLFPFPKSKWEFPFPFPWEMGMGKLGKKVVPAGHYEKHPPKVLVLFTFHRAQWLDMCVLRVLSKEIIWKSELILCWGRFVLIWFDSASRAHSNGRETATKSIGLFYFSSSTMAWCVCTEGIFQRNGLGIRTNIM